MRHMQLACLKLDNFYWWWSDVHHEFGIAFWELMASCVFVCVLVPHKFNKVKYKYFKWICSAFCNFLLLFRMRINIWLPAYELPSVLVLHRSQTPWCDMSSVHHNEMVVRFLWEAMKFRSLQRVKNYRFCT